jgi:hypothetical protein
VKPAEHTKQPLEQGVHCATIMAQAVRPLAQAVQPLAQAVQPLAQAVQPLDTKLCNSWHKL